MAVIKKFVVSLALVGLVVLGPVACSKPTLQGVYVADFSTSPDPTIALAGKLQKLSLRFEDGNVSMETIALGQSETARKNAVFRGDRIILSDPDDGGQAKWVMVIKDADTLVCQTCPRGMPRIWKK
jgi:hypothetical protein